VSLVREVFNADGAAGAAYGRAGIVQVADFEGVTPLYAPLTVAVNVRVPGEEPYVV
jgi:hypothetical protein